MKDKFRRISFAIGGAGVVIASTATAAFAVGTADLTVTTAFTTVSDNAVATLGAVAAIGVTIMGVFLAWKYGRKIFSSVAK